MTWTRRLFWFAGIYGLIILAPQYLMERRIGIDFPPTGRSASASISGPKRRTASRSPGKSRSSSSRPTQRGTG